MKEQFLQKITSYIEEQRMIGEGDIVFAGVSGGADSMCLLSVLLAYRNDVEFTLRVIHVEHGIRGAESLADAEYVQQFCEKHGILCEVVHVLAVDYAKERHVSVEEAARLLRYEAFKARADEAARRLQTAVYTEEEAGGQAACADKHSGARVRIAVAHHREDQAETVLWQMIRGSDVKGLGGMRSSREQIIRPLLTASRADIEAYLRGEGIAWREDGTNADRDYTRNRIRLEVLPMLTALNARAVGHLCETAERMQETEDYLLQQTKEVFARHTAHEPGGGLLFRASLLLEHPLMQRRVLYRGLTELCGSARDISTRHVELLRELFSLQVGRVLQLPYGAQARRVYEGVALFSGKGEAAAPGVFAFSPEQVQMEILARSDIPEISKKKYTKWFDYDKIKHNVQIRGRQNGDYLVIDSDGHIQKLKRYLVNEKIPARERDQLLLLADGAHIMWVIGYRISDYYKVDENTKRVLKVQLSGGKEDE